MARMVAVFVLVLVAPLPSIRAQEKPLAEKQKIEALIKCVEDMPGAKFIRNDKEYDAKTAAKFLRGKWDANEAQIKTARDFIEKAGKPYLIRLKDGKEIKSGDYLLDELKKLEKP